MGLKIAQRVKKKIISIWYTEIHAFQEVLRIEKYLLIGKRILLGQASRSRTIFFLLVISSLVELMESSTPIFRLQPPNSTKGLL